MFRKILKSGLLFFLVVFIFYLAHELYYLDKVYFFCPVEYKQDTVIIRHDSYGNGSFLSNRSGNRRHNGIDLQAKFAAAVYAPQSGRVSRAGFHRGMGNFIEIAHQPGGYVTVYGHLSKIDVRPGQRLRQAQKIGEVGKTGNANHRGVIPHLHLEIRQDNVPLDPMKFIE